MPKDLAYDRPTDAGLAYVNDGDPGLRRSASRGGWRYLDSKGNRLTDPDTVARIQALAIPPAWADVWICPAANGHIQAMGRDAKGRKQYRYHPAWRRDRDGQKFERMTAFGRALPRLRTRIEKDLARRGLPRDKVIAAVVRLMELTLIRVGNEAYVKENKSFGLTTLRDWHAKLSGVGGVFEFTGKSGKTHKTGFRDRRLARIVKACQDIPGQRLFQYLDTDGARRSVESADVNAYLRHAMGRDFSAKDFRTWAGTLGAARELCECPRAANASEAKRNVAACVKAVAGLLGNTAAVCRSAYIHPLVLESYEQGALPLRAGRSPRAFELAVIRFLEAAQASCSAHAREVAG